MIQVAKILALSCSPLMMFSVAFAAGVPEFSKEEKAQHLAGIQTLTSVASSCLESTVRYHDDFFTENGFSPFYGDLQKSFIAFGPEERISYLAEHLRKSEDEVASAIQSIRGGLTGGTSGEMKNMSCVGLVVRCLKKGFVSAGQQNLWAKIMTYTVAHDYDGTFMQTALHALGWKTYFWNPNLDMSSKWDSQEEKSGISDALKGYHQSRLNQVRKSGVYYYTPIDDAKAMVDFGNQTPKALQSAAFFVGTAHSGYHVFSGVKGRVVEGHAGRGALAFDLVEAGPFSPLTSAGKPSGQTYKSGVFAVPPEASARIN